MVANAESTAAHAAARGVANQPATRTGDELRRIADVSQRKINSENFPVALRLLPSRPREQLVRVYAYARFVDDVGDESGGDRLALLDAVERDVLAATAGRAELEPVRGLATLLARGTVPEQPLRDLIEANRRDQTVTSYETFDDLLGYCDLSAAPVGRIVLALAGVTDPDAVRLSDTICNALQVLEHCQDVREDALAGRVYLPAAELRAAGVGTDVLRGTTTTPALRRVIGRQVARADAMLEGGRPLLRQLHGWSRLAVLGYLAGGRAAATALRRADFDVLGRAVTPGKAATLGHALRLAAGR
jgi:squalene synthase HpnC